MSAVQRAYIYLACIASLQAVTWAAISLLRRLLAPGIYTSLEATSFQIAVVVVGLPIFVAHWLWARRLAGRDPEERGAVLRRLYLYGTMASFLAPFVANAFELLEALLGLALGSGSAGPIRPGLAGADVIVHHLVAMAVLAVLWAYHWRVAVADDAQVPEEGGAATVRRLYLYGFSAAGLALTVWAIVSLARWLLLQLGASPIVARQAGLSGELARLAVGLPLWLLFWTRAQRAFAVPDEEERASTLRKLYLYLAVFLGVLATVATLAVVLADLLERLFGASPIGGGGGDLREALSILLGAGLLWAYHAYVLRRDADLAGEAPAQGWIRRLYHYLVAAIGLAALLVGLGGDISLLIRALSGARFVRGIPQEAARFTALIIAGLPVWILPWRRLQLAAGPEAVAPGPAGDNESRSVIRKVYLYFYLFVATATVLASGVYLVARLIGLVLGVRPAGNLLADLGQAIAFSLLAVGVWLYHGAVLRADERRLRAAQARRLASFRVVVVDAGDGSLGRGLLAELERRLPGLDLQGLGLTPEAALALGTLAAPATDPAVLDRADLIVGPWTMALPGRAEAAGVAQAIAAHPARKLLLPLREEGWQWAGVDALKPGEAIRQAVRAVEEIAAGETGGAGRRLSAGAIVAIVVGVLVALIAFIVPLLSFLAGDLLD